MLLPPLPQALCPFFTFASPRLTLPICRLGPTVPTCFCALLILRSPALQPSRTLRDKTLRLFPSLWALNHPLRPQNLNSVAHPSHHSHSSITRLPTLVYLLVSLLLNPSRDPDPTPINNCVRSWPDTSGMACSWE